MPVLVCGHKVHLWSWDNVLLPVCIVKVSAFPLWYHFVNGFWTVWFIMNVLTCSFLCDNNSVKQGLSMLISLYHMFTGKCIAKFGQTKMLRLLVQSKWSSHSMYMIEVHVYVTHLRAHMHAFFPNAKHQLFRSESFQSSFVLCELHLWHVIVIWLIVLLLILTAVVNTYVHMCTPVQDVKEQSIYVRDLCKITYLLLCACVHICICIDIY